MATKIISSLIFSLIIFSTRLNAQNIESWIEQNEKVPVEKIYLHTDREIYFTGETIWFRSYLTDSRSGRLIPGAENIYVQLINEAGKTVAEITTMSINGLVSSQMELPDSLKPGNYHLQAFTDYLLNFGSDAFFGKQLSISKPARSLRAIESRKAQKTNPMVADVSFFPEGGMLLQGISNLVAFKAIDQNGYGTEATGSVRDESGNEIVSFKTNYKGMGLFFLTPEPGKSYHATINGFPAFRFSFDSLVRTESVKIQLVNQTSTELMVNISCNSEKLLGGHFYLVNMHRGQSVFYQTFTMENKNNLLKFKNDILKGGINQLILLDKNLNPVSELLVFSDNFNLKNLEIKTTNSANLPRSEIKLQIAKDEADDEILNLSLAVLHEAAIPKNGMSQNMISSLLIDSELNGFIETPADFFNNNGLDAKVKQRLLMLTNGWSSYLWNQVPATGSQLKYTQEAGLKLHGKATEVSTGQPLKNGEITLVIEKDREMAFLTQETDSEGLFSFSGLLFNDTANIVVQAKNERGKQNTAITLLPAINTSIHAEKVNSLNAGKEFQEELEMLKYNQMAAENAYFRKLEATTSDNKSVTKSPLELSDGHFRIYENADQVVEIPESEAFFGNVIDFLAGKVAGLDIFDNNVTLRGTTSFDGTNAPLFLIDGVPLSSGVVSNLPAEIGQNTGIDTKSGENSAVEKIKAIPLGDIEKVEILKSPQNLAIFGTEGANGVIAVYTRKGKSNKASNLIKGVIEQKIAGYSSYKKFYSPKYLPETAQPEKPDFRTTLFWEPEIVLQNGFAEVSFFTSDQTGKYNVILEGISESGEICIGSNEFEVVEQK